MGCQASRYQGSCATCQLYSGTEVPCGFFLGFVFRFPRSVDGERNMKLLN